MSDLLVRTDLPPVLRKADSLPSLPVVALEVLRLTQDEDATIESLAATIEHDPALAVKLLKLANSSLFNLGQEITTLQRTMMVLGMKTVKLMSLSFSLVGSLPASGKQHGFDFGLFWQRSLTSAVAARSLARLERQALGDEAFLCGLLGHLGRLVLATCLPEDYGEVVQRSGSWPSLNDEHEQLGFHNADVAATLLAEWDMPEMVTVPVAYAARIAELPADASTSLRTLTRIMHHASLAEEVLCGERKGAAMIRLREELASDPGLSAEELDDYLVGLEAGIRETAELLNMQLPSDESHEELLNRARMQIVQVGLGATADLNNERRRTIELESEKRALKTEATTDALTGLANRKAFDEFLEAQIEERLRGPVPRALGVILVDVDHFKHFNDTYGHQAGDEVLRMLGQVLSQTTRGADLAARYGGEEFAVIAPQTTPFGIRTLAERLRSALEEAEVRYEAKSLRITASFGAACVAQFQSTSDGRALVKLADHYLYKAKQAGRNRCETYPKIQLPGR